jgi:endoglucanase
MKSLRELIKEFVEAYGPSGSEQLIRELIAAEVRPYVDELRTDSMGNLFAVKHGGPQRVMFAAHMDEIGVMVTHIDEHGFLRFSILGGFAPWNLLSNRVYFANGTVGVVAAEKLEGIKELAFDKMYIDIGAETKEDAKRRVQIGDAGAAQREFIDLGQKLVSKAMDDRVACAILVDALRQMSETRYEVNAVFTVQEEVGTRGSAVAAFGLKPDLGIAVDITPAFDVPKSSRPGVELGKGPTVKIRDSSALYPPEVIGFIESVAAKNQIPLQREILMMGGTDAQAIQLAAGGIPASTISIATRYAHSPAEMVDYRDCENAARLIAALAREPFVR